MIIKYIKDLVNARLAGEQLTYSTLLPYLDSVVDEINSKLHAQFRTFSEVSTIDQNIDYSEFPDKYIRTVVAIGAAAKWYIDDEEGIETATALVQQYNNNLFIMVRDYGPLVPLDKKASAYSGFLSDAPDNSNCGINPNLRYIEVPGLPGTSVKNLKIVTVNGARHLFATLVDYSYGEKTIDCGVVSTEMLTVKLDAKGDFIALMSDGTVHKIGNMHNFIQQYFQIAVEEGLPSSAGPNTIGFEIEEF
jgi:hypothetical protein